MTESGRTSPGPDDREDSKSAYRKSNKPLMEKRRRARINTCLSELKNLVLQAMKKDNAQYSKLEKADILELTVKHLRSIQRQQLAASVNNSSVIHKYRAGFNECAGEVMRYLSSIPGVQDEVKGRVLGHLANCMQTVNVAPSPVRHLIAPPPLLHPGHLPATENSTAFHPVSRDHCSHAPSGQPPSFPSNPIQLVETSGPTAPVAFVLTSPSHVQAVPVYASSPPFNGQVKIEPKDIEECSPKEDNSGLNSNLTQSAFKDFTPSTPKHLPPYKPEPVVVKEPRDESMWRPW